MQKNKEKQEVGNGGQNRGEVKNNNPRLIISNWTIHVQEDLAASTLLLNNPR